MFDILKSIWSNDLYHKLILTGFVLFLQITLSRFLTSIIAQKIDEKNLHIYTLRKVVSYTINILGLLIIFGVWIERSTDLSVALGILAAGLAFALQELIGSFAGWLTIISGQPFTIGDRIETGGIQGDVIDIGVLRTTFMEIGNWLQGDHNTGRIVTVSNAFIFKEPLFNYSAYIHFIWDEISIPIPYECDWQKAVQIMIEAVKKHPQYQTLLPKAEEQHRQARHKLAVRITPLEPRVFVKLTDNWIELGMVYPVDTDLRRTFRSEVSQYILSEFAKENIEVASQTMAIVRFPSKESA